MEYINNWQWQDFDETQSTNDDVKKICEQASPRQQFVVTAQRQSNGRGRRGRNWVSLEGNLFVSFGLEIELKNLGQMIFVVGLSLLEAIKDIAPALEVSLKWPNDVLVNGRKVSGILLEKAAGDYLVIGVGVNIVTAPDIQDLLYPAISLKEVGVVTERISFLKKYISFLDANLAEWKSKGFAPIKERWLKYAKNLGAMIKVHTEKDDKIGEFVNVDENGILLLATESGIEKIYAGDVFYLKENEDK